MKWIRLSLNWPVIKRKIVLCKDYYAFDIIFNTNNNNNNGNIDNEWYTHNKKLQSKFAGDAIRNKNLFNYANLLTYISEQFKIKINFVPNLISPSNSIFTNKTKLNVKNNGEEENVAQ